MTVYFIDFEASSLSENSYPIEVGWGSSEDDIQSFLIKPRPDWIEWAEDSAKIHGIARETLVREGVDSSLVFSQLASALNGKNVVSDAPQFDTVWRDRLIDPGTSELFDFKISDLKTLLAGILYDKGVESVWDEVEKIKGALESSRIDRHRAAGDVRHMIRLFNAVVNYKKAT